MIQFFQNLLGESFIQALGITFLHSLWQGTIIAFTLYIILQKIDIRAAKKRYVLSSAALFIMLCSNVGTFIYYMQEEISAGPLVALYSVESSSSNLISNLNSADYLASFSTLIESAYPTIIFCWLMGLLLYLSRIGFGFMTIQKIKKESTLAEGNLQQIFKTVLQKLHINHPVELRTSHWINVPIAIGVLKPVVLFPIALINQLSPSQLEAIIAHELAHIRRFDFLQNIIQNAIEALYYYHPGVWYISKMIRKERENCCDDIAISASGNNLDYAKLLLEIQQRSNRGAPILAMPFFRNKKELLGRIKRILNQPVKKSNTMEKLVATSFCLMCFALLTLSNTMKEETIKTESEIVEFIPIKKSISTIKLDTIPKKKKEIIELRKSGEQKSSITRIKKYTDDQKIEIELKDDEIIKLKIDGNEIPQSDYVQYEKIVAELIEESANIPPPPPPAPRAPEAPRHVKGQMEINEQVPVPPPPPPPPLPPGASEKEKAKHKALVERQKAATKEHEIRKRAHKEKIEKQKETEHESFFSSEKTHRDQSLHGTTDIFIIESDGDGDNIKKERFYLSGDGPFEIRNNKFNSDSSLRFEFFGDKKMVEDIERNQLFFENDKEMIRFSADSVWFSDKNFESRNFKIDFEQENNLFENEENVERFETMKKEHEISKFIHERSANARSNITSGRSFQDTHPLNSRNDANSIIINELKKDNLITDDDNYKLQFSDKKMKVNGDKMSDKVHQKYIELYEKVKGESIAGSKISVQKKSN